MRLPEHERTAHREAFRAMTLPQKAEYVFAYYKLPLVLLLIAAVACGSVVKYRLTHKEALLYVAYANVALTEEQDEGLFLGFLDYEGASQQTYEVYRYYDLYLTEAEESVDHQYSYASRLKTLAAVDAEELDVVLMNQRAYDLLSHSGYLLDLDEALAADPALVRSPAQSNLTRNLVVLEDNRIEVELGEADEYEALTAEAANALDVTELIAEGGLTGNVYLGIIANTPRLDVALDLIAYLYGV